MNLRLDFFESGIGETIVVTFPNGDVGVIDAHPTSAGVVRALAHLDPTKVLQFVCLTHPHADHGVGLIPILKSYTVNEFWHTVAGIQSWMFALDDAPSYPSHFQQVADAFMAGVGNFVRGVFGTATLRGISHRQLNSRVSPIEIGGVKIHVLGPEEDDQNQFSLAYRDIACAKRKGIPDPNKLSAILALEYNGSVALLGGDALKTGWKLALKQYAKLNLPAAKLLKIPHHGASNAFDLNQRDKATYLGLCEPGAKGILFAGDADHPDERVQTRLASHLEIMCLANGKKSASRQPRLANPLGIAIPGARIANPVIHACQSHIHVEIEATGQVIVQQGHPCSSCP